MKSRSEVEVKLSVTALLMTCCLYISVSELLVWPPLLLELFFFFSPRCLYLYLCKACVHSTTSASRSARPGVWEERCSWRWGWGAKRGNRSVSLGMLTRSVYICSSLSLQPSTLNKREKVFWGCKAVVGKAWLDTLILLSFGRAWKETSDNKNKKGNEWARWKEMYFPITAAAFPKTPPAAVPPAGLHTAEN